MLQYREISLPGKPRDLWLRNPEVLTHLFLKEESITENHLSNTHSANTKYDKQQTINTNLTTKASYLCDYLRQVKYFDHFNDLKTR